LHDGDGGDRRRRDKFGHDLRIADIGGLDVKPCGLEGAEVFFDIPYRLPLII